MQNPMPSNKSKQGLFCTNCMKTSHNKDRCYYFIGFPICEYCNVKGHTKRRCQYFNDRAGWARSQMRTSPSYSKQGIQETDVRTERKPNQKSISMLSEGQKEMQNPTSSNKSKQGLFCANCKKTNHTKDGFGFPTCKYCGVKGHTKHQCGYLYGRTDWARNQMTTRRSYSKQGGQEIDVRTMRKPNRNCISMLSEGKTQVCLAEHAKGSGSNFSFRSSSQSKEVSKDNHDSAALDTLLPDDMLAKIFSFLPMPSIIRATTVCKRWYDAVHARKQDSWIDMKVQKPWYCMFDFQNGDSVSYSYDPTSQIWYKLFWPFTLVGPMRMISSSCGLLCFMDFAKYRVFIHNPITKETKQLPKLKGRRPNEEDISLSLSVDRMSPHSYIVVAVKAEYSYDCYELTIQIYEPERKTWVTRARENLQGWNTYDGCVICDKVLYYLIRRYDLHNPRIGLIMHDLSASGEASTSLMSTLSLLPTSLGWARLINMNDGIIMVGGSGDPFGPAKVSIWELHKRSVWEEIDRVPDEFIKRFSKSSCKSSMYCCGAEGLIYIRDLYNPDLLTFDMATKQWRWASKFPVPDKSNSLYRGFCFEPRLDVSP